MKQVRIIVCLFFVVACACYGAYTAKSILMDDKNAPVISFEEEEVVVGKEATSEELLQGVTAVDKEDGDLTDRIQIASMSRIDNQGCRTIQYIVFDDANLLGTAGRTVRYEGYISPRIYLKSPLRLSVRDFNTGNYDWNITVSDFIDGDLSDKVRVTYGTLMEKVQAGTYSITFQVNNSAGDSCVVPMELVLYDDTTETGKFYPLLREYIVYTTLDKKIDPSSYLQGIESSSESYIFGNSETPANISASGVAIQSNVDYSKAGVYTVVYSYTSSDNITASTTLYVVVED